MRFFMDLIPVTPAMEARFFIQENPWILIGAAAVAVVAAVLIIKAIKKRK